MCTNLATSRLHGMHSIGQYQTSGWDLRHHGVMASNTSCVPPMTAASDVTTSLHACSPTPSRPGSFSHLFAVLKGTSAASESALLFSSIAAELLALDCVRSLSHADAPLLLLYLLS